MLLELLCRIDIVGLAPGSNTRRKGVQRLKKYLTGNENIRVSGVSAKADRGRAILAPRLCARYLLTVK